MPEVRTTRLLLRDWRDSDREPFAAMKADPRVMAHFPAPASRAETDAMIDAMRATWAERGLGMWAVEIPGVATFIGYIGLAVVTFDAPFTGAIEVGWGLVPSAWGQGYATEGAAAALDFGFSHAANLDDIIAFTAARNAPSAAVMRRLGLEHEPESDFEHPRVPLGHPIRPHVFYRISRERWAVQRAESQQP